MPLPLQTSTVAFDPSQGIQSDHERPASNIRIPLCILFHSFESSVILGTFKVHITMADSKGSVPRVI